MTHSIVSRLEARPLPLSIVWLALLAFLIVACGGHSSTKTCDRTPCDGGAQTTDAAVSSVLGFPDAGVAPVESGPLVVSIAVSGAARSCGDCAVITAHASGGKPPYRFVWSDDQLANNAGPHEVCDETESVYSVTVRDTATPRLDDGTTGTSDQAQATVSLPCSAPGDDAGSGFSGCKLLLNASIITLLDPTGSRVDSIYSCSALDGSPGVPATAAPDAGSDVPPVAQYISLPERMLAGHSYQLSVELLLSLQVGGDERLEFWGTREGCSTDEKLGEVSFSGQQRATVCLSPHANYDKLLTRAAENSVDPDFAISLGISMTLCSDCTKQ